VIVIRIGHLPKMTNKVSIVKNDLRFLVSVEPRLLSLWKSLVALFSVPQKGRLPPIYPVRMFRRLDLRFLQRPARSLLGSAVFNVGIVFLLLWIAQNPGIPLSISSTSLNETYEIYYIPPVEHAKQKVPRITPAGPGGAPGQGELQIWLPRRGSTAFQSKLTAISQPQRPDNNHQTVIQPKIPMDIRWAEDLHLANLVLVNSMPQPKAPVTIRWHSPVPAPKHAKIADMAPPTLAATSPNAVIVVTGISSPAPALPVIQPIESDGTPPTQNSSSTVDNTNINGLGASEGGTLVVLSMNPNGASGVVGLPFGNRVGEFTISPDGMATGSPGGIKGASPGGGSASKGSGGDGSVGVGDGKTGGGGGGTAPDSGIISLNGNGAGPSGHTLASPPVAADMVFQLAPFTKFRKNVLIVSTGPIGGGGLGVYQALQCRKIYTVFLPMPETNWTLQYCVRDDPNVEQASKTAGITTTIHLQPGLVPPVPELQFDFKRVPVPPEKSRKMIVLKGTIREDGTVGDVQVYSGVLPLMDEAARLAFSRWKFTPALRSGKPVAVEILVGIAATSQTQ